MTPEPQPTPDMPDSYRIRAATPDDAHLLACQRVAMFRDMGRTVPGIEGGLLAASQEYLERALRVGEYVAWVAEDDGGMPIAGAGVQFRPLLPRTDPTGQTLLVGREGLILNVYVEPAQRRRGIARALMQTLLAWAPGAGIVRLVLHASDDGRPLYESLGFKAGNEMLYPRPLA
jgi:ribosomal protein S18 acetylase RimI-like enzyme